MSAPVSKYLDLITGEHQGQPNFAAAVTALVQGFADNFVLMSATMPTVFDLDTAYQQQLDYTGQWIGASRDISIPLTGIYFAFDSTGLGFDQGTWLGPFDNPDSTTVLPDSAYRLLLKARIALNHWNGNIPGAYAAINGYLNPLGYSMEIVDNQDMTMSYILTYTGAIDAVTSGLYQNGFFDLRPAGVGTAGRYYLMAGVPLFGFDIENSAIQGFDQGYWLSETPPPIYNPPVVNPGAAQFQLPGSPALVYSVRRLLAAWPGAAYRVRRDSDSVAVDIGYTSGGDFDAASQATFVGGANGYAPIWYEQGGSGHNATQTVAALQQRVVAAGAQEIKGSRQALHSLLADGCVVPAQTIASPWTAFIVQALDGTVDQRMLSGDGAYDWYLGYYNGQEEAAFLGGGAAVAREAATSRNQIYTAVSNLTSAVGFTDASDEPVTAGPAWASASTSTTANQWLIATAITPTSVRVIGRVCGSSTAGTWRGDGNAYTYELATGNLLSTTTQTAIEAAWAAWSPSSNFNVSGFDADFGIGTTPDGNQIVAQNGAISSGHTSGSTGSLYLVTGGPSGIGGGVTLVADIIPVLTGLTTGDTLVAVIPSPNFDTILVITQNSGVYLWHMVSLGGGTPTQTATGTFRATLPNSTANLFSSITFVGGNGIYSNGNVGSTSFPMAAMESGLTQFWISNLQSSQDLYAVAYNGVDWNLAQYQLQSYPTQGPIAAAPDTMIADAGICVLAKGLGGGSNVAAITAWSYTAPATKVYRAWENAFAPSFGQSNGADPLPLLTAISGTIRLANRNPFTTTPSPPVNGDTTIATFDPATGKQLSTVAQNAFEAAIIVNGYFSGDQGAHRWYNPIAGHTTTLIDIAMATGAGAPVVGFSTVPLSTGYGGVWSYDYASGSYLADIGAVCTPLPSGTGGSIQFSGVAPCADFRHVAVFAHYTGGTPTNQDYIYVVDVTTPAAPALVAAYLCNTGLSFILNGTGPRGWWADVHYDIDGAGPAGMLESNLEYVWIATGQTLFCVQLAAGAAQQIGDPSSTSADINPVALYSNTCPQPTVFADNGYCIYMSQSSSKTPGIIARYNRPQGSALVSLFRNGVQFASIADGIGSNFADGPIYFGGQMVGALDEHSLGTSQEFIVYADARSNASRQAIEFSAMAYYGIGLYANVHTNTLQNSASLADLTLFGSAGALSDSGSALLITGFAGLTQGGAQLSAVPNHSSGCFAVNVTVANPANNVAPALVWLTTFFSSAPNSFGYALTCALVGGSLILTLIRGSNSGGGANVVLATYSAGSASIGDIHRIEVDYNAGTHTVCVDGVAVGSVTDTTYTTGQAALLGVCSTTTVDAIAFDSLYLSWQ